MSKENEIKANVFEKIRKGEVSMRPRIYFIARISLLAVLSVIALALALFVLSFAFFSIHESGEQFLLGFGQRGFLVFITLFPWWFFLLTVALILILDYLLRYFKFGYRISMLEIFFIALAVIILAGIGINFTPLHSSLLNVSDRNELPIIGPLYEGIHDSHQERGVYRGVISSIQGNTFTISHDDRDRDTDDGTSTIMVPTGFATTTLYIGERVFVAGSPVASGTVQAYGIQQYGASREVK